MLETSHIFTLVMGMILGLLTAHVALRKERNPMIWFLIGFLFGVVGLLILFLLAPMGFGGHTVKSEDTAAQVPQAAVPLVKADETPATVIKSAGSTEWYYLDAEWQQQGPLTLAQLEDAWQKQQLTLQSYVWCPAMVEWKPVEALPSLRKILQTDL